MISTKKPAPKHILVDPNIHAKLKIVSAMEGLTMGEFISKSLKDYKIPTEL